MSNRPPPRAFFEALIALAVLASTACNRPREEARSKRGEEPASATESAPAEPEQAHAPSEHALVVARAQQAITPFKQRLSKALSDALRTQGPLAAIDVCAQVAPRLAEEASSEGVQVGRSALKLRNENNAARPWLQPLLSEMAKLQSPENAQRVVQLDPQRFGYAEAIVLQPQCVMCHGKNVAPELATKIRERYPNDQAVGFEPGELRGVFWAEVSL